MKNVQLVSSIVDNTGTIGIIAIAAGVIIILAILASGYVKASPDTAFIISGLRKNPKFLIGKAGIKIPFLEKKDELNLRLIPIDVKTASSVPTADYINVNVDAAVNVKISDNPERLKLAAQNFLNKDTEYIGGVAKSVLEGNTREIVGKMRLEEMVSNRQKFALLVKENAEPDLAAMGLDIVSFNVQNFIDENQVIENLGIDNIVQIKKSASIARAEGERDIKIAQAKANKEANDASVESERQIAERNNELSIKKSELKKVADIKQAEADAAYSIQQEEQRKSIETTRAQADIAKEEQYVILKQKEAAVKEQALDAEIRKQAEAEKFAKEQQAEAELYQRKKEAEAKKYELEQEAEGIRAKGIAEAEAIRAKAVAEAEGIEKKAIAMQKYGEAAILEMFFKAFPEAVRNAAEPLASIDSITMYGQGNNEQMVGSVMNTVTQVSDGIKGSTGIDLKSIISQYVGAEGVKNFDNGESVVFNPDEFKKKTVVKEDEFKEVNDAPKVKAETKTTPVATPKAEVKTTPVVDTKVETKTTPVATPKPEVKITPVVDTKVETKTTPVVDTKVETKTTPVVEGVVVTDQPRKSVFDDDYDEDFKSDSKDDDKPSFLR
ncbi:MAG: flotillin family protein [Lachnospiraceae bacterium]|nr:flotillin family protein [Lachnospiraceae bacterium]